MIAHRHELQLRQVILQRVDPHRLDVHQVTPDGQQQRAAAQHLRRVPDPHRHLLVHRPIVVDVGVDLFGARDECSLRDLQAE